MDREKLEVDEKLRKVANALRSKRYKKIKAKMAEKVREKAMDIPLEAI